MHFIALNKNLLRVSFYPIDPADFPARTAGAAAVYHMAPPTPVQLLPGS